METVAAWPPAKDFNPRSPCGERRHQTGLCSCSSHFNPRSPCGERRSPSRTISFPLEFQSTLSLRRATVGHRKRDRIQLNDFNPRSPCGERPEDLGPYMPNPRFQSTLSLRRATVRPDIHPVGCGHFNPRSPCGERLDRFSFCQGLHLFQSTLSLRRATGGGVSEFSYDSNFNPRSPCGERQDNWMGKQHLEQFQSTLSLRRATKGEKVNDDGIQISIHALLAESDFGQVPPGSHRVDFNPRSPCGERRQMSTHKSIRLSFQSTLSLRRATGILQGIQDRLGNFNPRSPCGERQRNGQAA